MDKGALILLIQDHTRDGERLRQALANDEGLFRVQSVNRIAIGLARIAGGGVDLVVLDLSHSDEGEVEKQSTVLKLRSKAPEVPVVVVHDSDDDSLVLRTMRAGAADCLPRARCDTDLGPLVRFLIGRRLRQPESRPHPAPESRKEGCLSTFMGAKGGVGTTTVALNVASALAQHSKTILTEMRPMFGTLSPYFRLRHCSGNITHLLQADPDRIGPGDVEALLWPYRSIPGLNILFGPQTTKQCGEVTAHSARAILRAATMIADHVVVDLPTSLSEANRAAIQQSTSLLLVVERDQLCVESAKPILEAIFAWKTIPPLIGSVIVNRAALAVPMDLAEIQRQLNIPILGVIPPAADLCIAAQKSGMPLLRSDPDNIVTRGMVSLAEALVAPSRMPARAS